MCEIFADEKYSTAELISNILTSIYLSIKYRVKRLWPLVKTLFSLKSRWVSRCSVTKPRMCWEECLPTSHYQEHYIINEVDALT